MLSIEDSNGKRHIRSSESNRQSSTYNRTVQLVKSVSKQNGKCSLSLYLAHDLRKSESLGHYRVERNVEKLLLLTHRQDRWRLHQALPRHYRRIQPDPASGASTDAKLLKLGSSLCSLSTSYLTGSCIEMKDTVINLQL